MAKQRETTAIVFVDRDWYDQTLRFLIDMPKSDSTVNVHLLQGEMLDAGHHAGLWMRGVPTRHVRKGSTVDMDYMIPWKYVLGLGAVKEKGPIGFKSSPVQI